jgi:hypothetical protein
MTLFSSTRDYTGSFVGYTDGTLLSARFGTPQYLTIDGEGNLYVSDKLSNNYFSIRRLSVHDQNVTTMAGKTCT